jgi:hypothetical protein
MIEETTSLVAFQSGEQLLDGHRLASSRARRVVPLARLTDDTATKPVPTAARQTNFPSSRCHVPRTAPTA